MLEIQPQPTITIAPTASNTSATGTSSKTTAACQPHLTHASSNMWYTISNSNLSPPKFLDGSFDADSDFSYVHLSDESRGSASQEWFFMRIQDSNPPSKIACGDPTREAVLFWITNHAVPKDLDARLGLDSTWDQYAETGANGTEMKIGLNLAPLDEADEGQL
ncbi:hypothetical protein GE09DRAFT_1070251, partial [Coniochaeta sp. 2T2.1]